MTRRTGEDCFTNAEYIGSGLIPPAGTRLIIPMPHKTAEREMDRTLIAVISGILEGILICSGIFTQNAFVLGVAVIFFVIQWRYLGK